MGAANRATTLVLRRTVFVYKLESRSYIARTGDGCIPSRLVTEIELLWLKCMSIRRKYDLFRIFMPLGGWENSVRGQEKNIGPKQPSDADSFRLFVCPFRFSQLAIVFSMLESEYSMLEVSFLVHLRQLVGISRKCSNTLILHDVCIYIQRFMRPYCHFDRLDQLHAK